MPPNECASPEQYPQLRRMAVLPKETRSAAWTVYASKGVQVMMCAGACIVSIAPFGVVLVMSLST